MIIDNALTSHGLGAQLPPEENVFFFFLGRFVFVFLVLLCFVCSSKTIFIFLSDLKYTGRIIASSSSAFISKIINPRVSHRYL